MRIAIENPNLGDSSRVPSPTQSFSVAFVQPEVNYEEYYRETFHSLWLEIHTKQDPTPEWFLDWCARVPNISCGCQAWLADYLTDHQPDYADFSRWAIDLHSAVNAKLGKPIWTSA